MRGLQGTFPRCKKCLPSGNKMRRLVLDAIILVHNFWTDYVGYNQIKSVFDPEYARSESLEGYDRISQYYYHPGDYDSEVDGEGSDNDDMSDIE